MFFLIMALVAVWSTWSVAHVCAHHAVQPQLLNQDSHYRVPTYEAPQVKAATPNYPDQPDHPDQPNHVHVHAITRIITRTTHATTTLTSTTLPPLLTPTPTSLYQTSSSISSESLRFHEDLKIKRDETPTPTGTHTPLFTGHGPVQPGLMFTVQGQSVTFLSGTLVKVTGTANSSESVKTASASASKATSSSDASLVGVGIGSMSLWGIIMLLVGLM